MPTRLLAASLIPLAIAACNPGVDPDEEVSEEAAEIAEEAPVFGERSDADVAGVTPTEGMRWFYKPATQTALYGPADSEAVISLSCNESMTGETLLDFQWIAPATAGASETVAVSAGDAGGSFPVRGIASALGPDAIWQGGIQRGDAVVEVLADAEQPITFTLGDRSITTPVGEPLARAIAACA
ncbi:hypothetical protein [Qipengyuania sp. MTN3-11]|uniref:hypothetical protein n=1 Tax=Qipengyuania sp. MTN3-11 TaxID=3056557 RepID=UPI0036F42961